MAENIVELLTDVADAIREKKGSTEKINAQSFSDEIKNLPSGGGGKGHADVEGLRAIGWTDEDIAYYQENGVNWSEEDDKYHKVSDDNKALYGVLTADNIQTYKDRIVFLPKIDISTKTNVVGLFGQCRNLKAIPFLDFSNVTNMNLAFRDSTALVCIPPLNTNKVTNCELAFYGCMSLIASPKFNSNNIVNFNGLFTNCYNMVVMQPTNLINITSLNEIFGGCYSLRHFEASGLSVSLSLKNSSNFEIASLLYIISNEAATSPITITLHASVYDRAMADAEITAALAAHPNVSLAKA